MLEATQEEADKIISYMNCQAPDLQVEFCQKIYAENVLSHRHDVWDVHTDKDRWWVITNPTNLYSQDQFPNMDLALTFHVGLCLRIPRSEKPKLSDLHIEPFGECWRCLSEASEALKQAQEVTDYQSIGVRCREALLAFADAAQTVIPWTSEHEQPKRADMKAWADHICAIALPGPTHEHRRHLFKTLLDSAWKFANWLTHAKTSKWHDAEAGFSTTEHAIGLCTTTIIMRLRKVPEECPACGSHRLTPERGTHEDFPEEEFERPVCMKCGWAGDPVLVEGVPRVPDVAPDKSDQSVADSECYIPPKKPLRTLLKPDD
jgi:hypothetical protein